MYKIYFYDDCGHLQCLDTNDLLNVVFNSTNFVVCVKFGTEVLNKEVLNLTDNEYFFYNQCDLQSIDYLINNANLQPMQRNLIRQFEIGGGALVYSGKDLQIKTDNKGNKYVDFGNNQQFIDLSVKKNEELNYLLSLVRFFDQNGNGVNSDFRLRVMRAKSTIASTDLPYYTSYLQSANFNSQQVLNYYPLLDTDMRAIWIEPLNANVVTALVQFSIYGK